MKKPIYILVRLLRALAGISLFPLALILGLYTITIAPIFWILTGNNTIDFLKENFLEKYLNFIKGVEINKGCLYGKTIKERDHFFRTLFSFNITDPVFYTEQYFDLLPLEKEAFMKWLIKNKKSISLYK